MTDALWAAILGRMDATAIRRGATTAARRLALASAPLLGDRTVRLLERLVARTGPHVPILGRMTAENMRAVGVYTPLVHQEHFARLAAHLADALRVWRFIDRSTSKPPDPPTDLQPDGQPEAAQGPPAHTIPAGLAEIVQQRVRLDASIERLREYAVAGRGVVLVGLHIVGFLLSMARLNQVVPLTVLLRHSRDPQKLRDKRDWMRAIGLHAIAEPARSTDAAGRVARMAEVVRSGRILHITPDLPQKRGEGRPVEFFGRTVYLPPGAVVVALRAAAPLFFLTARPRLDAIELAVIGPFEDSTGGEQRARLQARIQARMDWYATEFEHFVRSQPALWYFWADKRWTRVLRGDPAYIGLGGSDAPEAGPGQE